MSLMLQVELSKRTRPSLKPGPVGRLVHEKRG